MALLLQSFFLFQIYGAARAKWQLQTPLVNIYSLSIVLLGAWVIHTIVAMIATEIIPPSSSVINLYEQCTKVLIIFILIYLASIAFEWHHRHFVGIYSASIFMVILAVIVFISDHHTQFVKYVLLFSTLLITTAGMFHPRRIRRRRSIWLSIPMAILTISLYIFSHEWWAWFFALSGVIFGLAIYLAWIFPGLLGVTLPGNILRAFKNLSSQDDKLDTLIMELSSYYRAPIVIRGFYRSIYAQTGKKLPLLSFPFAYLTDCHVTTTIDEAVELSPRLFEKMMTHEVQAIIPIYGDITSIPIGWCLIPQEAGTNMRSRKSLMNCYMNLAKVFAQQFDESQLSYVKQETELQNLSQSYSNLLRELREHRSAHLDEKQPQIWLYADRIIANDAKRIELEFSRLPRRLVYLGRDRVLMGLLRKAYPSLKNFAAPNKQFFSIEVSPDLIVFETSLLNQREIDSFITWVKESRPKARLFLTGINAKRIARQLQLNTEYLHIDIIDDNTPKNVKQTLIDAGLINSEISDIEYSLIDATTEFEAALIKHSLWLCEQDTSLTAQVLGIPLYNLKTKMKQLSDAKERIVKNRDQDTKK